MVADSDANLVYVSDLPAGRFSSACVGPRRILAGHAIGFRVLKGTKDIWIRDYAPIQVDDDGSFVLFRYFPDYLRHGYRHLITDVGEIVPNLPAVRNCELSGMCIRGFVARKKDSGFSP